MGKCGEDQVKWVGGVGLELTLLMIFPEEFTMVTISTGISGDTSSSCDFTMSPMIFQIFLKIEVGEDGFRERNSQQIQGPFLDPSGYQPPAAVKIQMWGTDSPTK